MTILALKAALAPIITDIPTLNAAWPVVENWAAQQIDAAVLDKAAVEKTLADLQSGQASLVTRAQSAIAAVSAAHPTVDLSALAAITAEAAMPSVEKQKAALAASIASQQAELAAL